MDAAIRQTTDREPVRFCEDTFATFRRAPLHANCESQLIDALRQTAHLFQGSLRESYIHHFRKPGKLLRGQLAFRVAKSCGATSDDSLNWAVAVELLHNATLLHDDICDKDACRRGQASVASLYGDQVALCLGDALIAESYSAAARCNTLHDPVQDICAATRELAHGQASEFSSIQYPSRNCYLQIARSKTTPLFVLPVVGAMKGRNTSRQTSRVKTYLGTCAIAFQALNDLSNLAGHTAEDPCSDFLEMRPNLAIALFSDSLDERTKTAFDELYAQPLALRKTDSNLRDQLHRYWHTFISSSSHARALDFTLEQVRIASQQFSNIDRRTAINVAPLQDWLLQSTETARSAL